MPPTPDAGLTREIGRDLAEGTVALYAGLEQRLAAGIAQRLAAGMDAPDWAERKLAAAGELRRWSRVLVERVGRESEHEITQALLLAYMRGGTEAMRAIAALQNTLPEWVNLAGIDPGPRIRDALDGRRADLGRKLNEIGQAFPGITALMQIVRSLVLRIDGTHMPVLRWTEDVYREVIVRTALPGVTLGLATRRRAAQVAWEQLLSRGVTGFTDRSGRNWELASYVEMAVRTGTAQAAVEGHLDRLQDAGLDLVIVSNAPQECERCRPWEGKILTRRGPGGRQQIPADNVITGRSNTIEIAGSLDEAIAKGLLHPNCRHSISLYLHGATRAPTHTADLEGDAARQRLRELERKVRKAKLKANAAIDPAARKTHEVKVRDIQRQIRDHVDTNERLGIFRQRQREQIGVAR